MSEAKICCSFCGKGRKDVLAIVEGPTVYICNECNVLCGEIIAERLAIPVESEPVAAASGDNVFSYTLPIPEKAQLEYLLARLHDERETIESRIALTKSRLEKAQ